MEENNKTDLPPEEQPDSIPAKAGKRFSRILISTVSSALVAAAIIVLLSWLLSPALNITGSGMSPTLSSGQTVLCSKFSDIEQGDIIAFYYNRKILVKRVIGLPGDTIEISGDGTVIRNGSPLDEPYISDKSLGKCDMQFPCTLDDGCYFVMGDNRDSSVDSRYSQIGCVYEENIIGKVYLRILPLKHFGAVD